ncbi:Hypothetical predicted protein, partial [Paramuricea clavata]
SEGPQDLLTSLRHPPTVNISDIPTRLATFVNHIEPSFLIQIMNSGSIPRNNIVGKR